MVVVSRGLSHTPRLSESAVHRRCVATVMHVEIPVVGHAGRCNGNTPDVKVHFLKKQISSQKESKKDTDKSKTWAFLSASTVLKLRRNIVFTV